MIIARQSEMYDFIASGRLVVPFVNSESTGLVVKIDGFLQVADTNTGV